MRRPVATAWQGGGGSPGPAGRRPLDIGHGDEAVGAGAATEDRSTPRSRARPRARGTAGTGPGLEIGRRAERRLGGHGRLPGVVGVGSRPSAVGGRAVRVVPASRSPRPRPSSSPSSHPIGWPTLDHAGLDGDLDEGAAAVLDLHVDLVGHDLADHVADLDLVADLDHPGGHLALGHRHRHLGHQDGDARHVRSPSSASGRRRRCRRPGGTAATSRAQGVGDRDVEAAEPADRRQQPVDRRRLDDPRGDLRGEADMAGRLLDQQGAARARRRPRGSGRRGTACAGSMTETSMPSAASSLGRLEGLETITPVATIVTSRPPCGVRRSSERDAAGLLGHSRRRCGRAALLQHDDRVGVVDRGQQQALGVVGGRRHDDLEAGHVREPGLQALRVLGRGPVPEPMGRASPSARETCRRTCSASWRPG